MGFDGTEVAVLQDFVGSWPRHDGPLLFVGSGMSRHETVPKPGVPPEVTIADWNALIAKVIKSSVPVERSLDGSSQQDNLGVAQAYADSMGRRRLIDLLEQEVPYKKFDPGQAFDALIEIDWAAIITTNYDDFLERTFERRGRSYVKLVTDQDLSRGRDRDTLEIVKMHGDLEQADTIVLGTDDYQTYSATREGIQSYIRVLMSKHPALFVGFSLTDPNVTETINWVGRRVAEMRLHSVALVHEEPHVALALAWAARGVRLVRLPRGRTVEEFLRSLYHCWRPGPVPRAGMDEASTISRLRRVLETRPPRWIELSAELAVEVAGSQIHEDLNDAVHRVLYGGLHGLVQSEILGILGHMPTDHRRRFLLAARRFGIVEGRGKGGGIVDVEKALLEDEGLDGDVRGEVLVLRAERFEREGTLSEAMRDLTEAIRLFKDASRDTDARGRLRRLVLRIGDEELIAASLAGPIDEADAFALTRRGADLLMTRGRADALPWYERARKVAKNDDEKTAALLGIQICDEPGEWRDLSELDLYWPSIRDGERPRVRAITDLEKDAADEVLRRYREGAKAGRNEERAASHLEQALVEADDMGWPRSPSQNFTGHVDGIAYSLAGLLLREGASEGDLIRGMRVFIERGLLQMEGRLSAEAIERILNSVPTDRLREILVPRHEALFMRRSRALLASAFLSVFSDDQIVEHVARVIGVLDLERKSIKETSASEMHLGLLQRQYHCLPRAAALSVVRLFGDIFSNDELAWYRHAKWAWLPIHDWSKTGVIRSDDPEVQALITAIVAGLASGTLGTDSFVLTHVLRLLDEAQSAGAIDETLQEGLVVALDDLIERGITGGREVADVFSLVLARHEVRTIDPSGPLRALFLDGYARLRNSTAAGTWMNLVDIVGRHLAPTDQARVAADIDDYTKLTLRRDEAHRFLGPFPDWPATAINQGVKAGILDPSKGWRELLRLAETFPECIVRSIGVQGTDLVEAGRLLLAAFAQGRVDRRVLLRWCASVPRGSAPMQGLERALLGQLTLPDGEAKQIGYWCLGWLAENGALSREGMAGLRESVLSYGVRDAAWRARAGAVVAAAKAKDAFSEAELDSLQAESMEDLIAGVRRSGALLAERRHR